MTAANQEGAASLGFPHTYAVGREMLRPGWTFKSGKWVGRWVPKVKSKRQEEREAAFERLKLAWPVGMHVEVEQTDDGQSAQGYQKHCKHL